ncbi:AAA family ATPase [Acidobacteria bacterium AH-259-D05]|nr:AAA family ATPase [Acidobacteria bacterium AH-259-D05]
MLTLLSVNLSGESQKLELETLFTRRKSLDHPLLVPVRDLAFRGKKVGFVSEFIDGLPLSKGLSTLSSWQKRRSLALQLVGLLAYLHRKGFLCGFIKPTQLFVLPGGRLMANFLVPEGRYLDKTPGSDWIRYAAPEFLCTGKANYSSDLYSLGMVFYHLFTGYAPYVEKDLNTLKRKQLVASPVRPKKLNPDIPAELEQLIRELTQKDPRTRPSSADYVAAALKEGCDIERKLVPRFRSELVGRDVELASFRELIKRHLGSGGTRFIAISGVSGIGKTGLMEHFETIAQIHKAKTFTISHHPGSGILEAFTQLFHRINGEPKVSLYTSSHLTNWNRKSVNPTDFAQDFLRLLKRTPRGVPIVLCVNDLQWMDEGSLVVYKEIFAGEKLPITVIGNYRTDELPGHWEELKSELSQRQALSEFKLRGVDDKEVRSLITNLLGDSPSVELHKKVVSRAYALNR